ncbi:hypothetical protein SB725_17320 [Pseudomonas sp. SIMBA_041]|uniref:hypothetical protein n=1 Tax=Pseudomonas sp. SIMBA_041 TaxID=3085782 RepID=UPI003978D5F3
MQVMLKSFLFKRPDWFKREGYWRLAQVLRLGLTFAFLATSVFFLSISVYVAVTRRPNLDDAIGFTVAWFVGAVAYVIIVHWVIRLIVWIADGFKIGSESK